LELVGYRTLQSTNATMPSRSRPRAAADRDDADAAAARTPTRPPLDRFAAHDASPLFPDRFGRVAVGSFAPFRMRFKITALDAGGPPGAAATREPGPGGAIERPRLIDGTA